MDVQPTSGLDPVVRSELLDMLQEIVMEEEVVGIIFHTYYDRLRAYRRLYYIHSTKVRLFLLVRKMQLIEKYVLVEGVKR